VSWPEVDDPEEGQPLRDGKRAEIGIVRQDNSAFCGSPTQNRDVRTADQGRLSRIDDSKAFTSKKRDHTGVDVLIGQQRKLAEFHATLAVK